MAFLLLSGCASYTQRAERFLGPYRAGQYERAAMEAGAIARDADRNNSLLLHLEEGAAWRAAGDFARSQEAFAKAEQVLEYWDEQPDVKLSAGAAATVTNQRALPYRGRAYDRIMLNTYQALNAMALDDPASARMYLRRAYEQQRRAVQSNARQIERLTEQARSSGLNVDRSTQSPQYRQAMTAATANLNSLLPYAPFVNPFTEYLQGIFYLAVAVGPGEVEQSLQSFERTLAMAPRNDYVQADVAMAQQVAQGQPVPAVTYVILEAGLAPHRESVRIDLPVFIVGGPVDYVGAALPRLQPVPGYTQSVRIVAGGETHEPQLLADMDSVIGQDFELEMPEVITKTLIATASKAALAYGARSAVRGDATTETIVRLVAGLYQFSVNQADLRTWLTLPKRFSIARFATPTDASVTLAGPGLSRPMPVNLEPKRINVIYIKSVRPGGAMTVHHFALP